MAHVIPGVGREGEDPVTSTVIRSVIDEVVALDLHKFVEGTLGNLLGVSRGLFLFILFSGLLGVLWHQIPDLPLFIFAWVVGTSPIWILPAAVGGGRKAWVWYVQAYFITSKKGYFWKSKCPASS